MLKITLSVFSFCLLFYLNTVCKTVSCFSLHQKTNVVDLNSMWELLKKKPKKHYVFSLYYSKTCPYCNKVRQYLMRNNQVTLVEIEDEDKISVKKLKRPIIIKMKKIYVDSLYHKTHFYYELLRSKKVQVPALAHRDCIMFESDDIISLVNQLTQFILRKNSAVERHRNKINRGENKSHLQAEEKINWTKDNLDSEENLDSEDAEGMNITEQIKNKNENNESNKTDDAYETEPEDTGEAD